MEGAKVRRLGKWYGDALAMMLEHARMDQRLIFLLNFQVHLNYLCSITLCC
jgi:hypothetical protein